MRQTPIGDDVGQHAPNASPPSVDWQKQKSPSGGVDRRPIPVSRDPRSRGRMASANSQVGGTAGFNGTVRQLRLGGSYVD